MPLFEYKCKNCGKIFEELVKSCEDKVCCPHCAGEAERNYSGRIYTATGKQTGGCSGNCSMCKGCGK